MLLNTQWYCSSRGFERMFGCMNASPLAAELKARPTGRRVLRGTRRARRHSRVSEGLITLQRHTGFAFWPRKGIISC